VRSLDENLIKSRLNNQSFSLARLRLLSAIFARPSGVRGPVEHPPCILQRLRGLPWLSSVTFARQE
jgi:hypothetical protein